jgi:hypothetical protein
MDRYNLSKSPINSAPHPPMYRADDELFPRREDLQIPLWFDVSWSDVVSRSPHSVSVDDIRT